MGLEFFKRSVEYAEKYRRPGQQIVYTIQTNGTNAHVQLNAGGTNSMVMATSNTEVRLTAPTVKASAGSLTGAPLGARGYIEMTGYGGSMAGRL